MDLEILILHTLKNKFVDIDVVKTSIRNLYPYINLNEIDSFHNYLMTNRNTFSINSHKWTQYYKIQSHYKDGIGSEGAIDYMSSFDMYCQINCLYKAGNYYY